MAHPDLINALEDAFGLHIQEMRAVGGGDIASSYLLETTQGKVFAKILDSPEGLGMLEAEQDGLKAISRTHTLHVPKVLGCAPTSRGACLLLEYIPAGAGSGASSATLGRGLAAMHQDTSPDFGWSRPNFIGSLPQKNDQNPSWASFYVRNRLVPQYRLARSRNLLSEAEIPDPDLMEQQVASLAADIRPSLLHGDLWGGNYLIASDGAPYLIDPAVYYGHAEVDLAMSLLFGGFSREFYDAYFEVHPKLPGFERRVQLYQLYYLLVHLNLFGRSYYGSVRSIGAELFAG